ncbi:methyltransferase [Oxalobacteraceae bacterium OTU3CINTB1]|nr:methyltransferase [Oxalobacteraceae bacterium OTU3CINTB1]
MTPGQTMLHAATGLSLSKAVVDRAIRQRVEVTGARDAGAYLEDIAPAELEALVELVVVPESWFYRDQQAFHAAADYLSTRLASTPERMLRILTVPCAGGEEPYTMAMVLSDAGIAPDRFIIDAVDISKGCIERARTGLYGRNAFRNQDLGFRERHFTACEGDEFRINDDIRKQVRFKQGNILEADLDARTGSYDVIFCRNLLIYFDKPTTKAAIAKLDQLLRRDGLLFVGYAEVPSLCQNGFAPLPYAQAFGLTREAEVERRKVARPAMPPPPRPTPRSAPAAVSTPARPPTPPPSSARLPSAAPAATAAPKVDLLADARRLADLGQLKEAEGKCRDYLAQVPDSAEAYFILGLLNELTKKLQLAEDYWKRCIYLQPDHYEALCHLALLAETKSDTATAAALKARAARIYKRQQAS